MNAETSKKAPSGAYAMLDFERHRATMSKIAEEIHKVIGDGNGRSAQGNLQRSCPSVREPKRSVLSDGCTLSRDYPAYSVWNYKTKRWVMYHTSDHRGLIKYYFTDGEMRPIGHAHL